MNATEAKRRVLAVHPDGEYFASVSGHSYRVQLHTRLADPWPSKREVQFAHFIGEHPRFPIPVEELLGMEATLAAAAGLEERNDRPA